MERGGRTGRRRLTLNRAKPTWCHVSALCLRPKAKQRRRARTRPRVSLGGAPRELVRLREGSSHGVADVLERVREARHQDGHPKVPRVDLVRFFGIAVDERLTVILSAGSSSTMPSAPPRLSSR
ncbi:hypothetical protein B296_00034624 [Ensete ventricosum]|uniref:Uncharacterized protein n=1 Tax=Ensete ventricosum TaxID=4639 RepID=A0A426Y158_ENSVE|nr:hypothetical protein B296_00034624 [Ensete ventricosum]